MLPQNHARTDSAAAVTSKTKTVATSSRGRLPITGCAGQPISSIVILTQPPYVDRLPRAAEIIRKGARLLHYTTRDEVIRRYLLLETGDKCDQIKRAESERILRAQPFLVDARIQVYDDEAGGVRLEVETRDDFSLLIEPNAKLAAPYLRGMRLGESNLAGAAKMIRLAWRQGFAYNDAFGVYYTDYQFMSARNELRVVARRGERDQELRAEVVRPYYTDLQRIAWIGSSGSTRDYTEFYRPGFDRNAINVTRDFSNVGAVFRVGPVGTLRVLGLLFTRESEHPDSLAAVLTPDGLVPDTIGRVPVRFREQNVMRSNLLFGIRRIRFARVQGFDALTGAQDLRIGGQLGLVIGNSMRLFGARDNDRFIASNLYVGMGNERQFGGIQLTNEARFDRDERVWDNSVVSGRAAYYFKPSVRQLTLAQVEFSAGYNMRSPFQLSFADRDGGLRGYRKTDEPGAQRMVFRAEQRLVIPTRRNVADGGIAVFAEAGKLWKSAGVPYSITTPLRSAVGVSLLAAVPPKSRRLWRVDFALPVNGGPGSKFEVRISSDDRTRVFWREPNDVGGGRERTVPTSLFTWP